MIDGTVKGHSEYQGIKQTQLSRVVVHVENASATALIEGEDLTRFGLSTAVTRASQDMEFL